MIEVEIKLKIRDPEGAAQELLRQGFVSSAAFREEDHYYDNESGQIRAGGEALRIRKVTETASGQETSVITFKGKKLDQVSMTRQELETVVADAAICHQIFESMGYSPVKPAVIKTRQEYKKGPMTACLDQVEGLGDFLEIENIIGEDEDREAALSQIGEVLLKAGYSPGDTTTKSYLSMLQGREV